MTLLGSVAMAENRRLVWIGALLRAARRCGPALGFAAPALAHAGALFRLGPWAGGPLGGGGGFAQPPLVALVASLD